VLAGLLVAGLVGYGLALLAAALRLRSARWLLGAGLALHLAGFVGRGVVVGFLPSGRADAFSVAAVAVALVTLVAWKPERGFCLPLLAATAAILWVALTFPQDLRYPPPVLRTVWYLLHVPTSFVCYGLWLAAGAAGLQWWLGRDPAWLRRTERLALQGFGLWSLSMVFGGIWGGVAWGAWFLWDPKFVWSVILWFHYAGFLHLRMAPSLAGAERLRVALAWLGCLWVLVAWIGTSFFFGGSSHAF